MIIAHFRMIVKCYFGFSQYSAFFTETKTRAGQIDGKTAQIQAASAKERTVITMEYSRFEQLLRTRGVTVYQVAKATGIAASTFTDWKNGRSVPKADKLARIAAFFSVSLDELMGTENGQRDLESCYRAVRACKMVPVIGVIRAGMPIVTDETLLGHEFADVEDVEDFFYLEVCGDSMKNCGIVNGTYVLFRKQQYAENGDIVACLVDGESATVKRFEKKNHRIVLSPENDDYEPIVLTPEDFETGRSRILGVAVEAKTRF